MKLTSTSQFDAKLVDNTQAYKDLQPFIDYTLQFLQNIERIIRQNVSLGDNIDCEIKTFDLASGSSIELTTKKTPIGLLLFGPTSNAITSYTWSVDSQGNTVVAATYATAATQSLKAVIFY